MIINDPAAGKCSVPMEFFSRRLAGDIQQRCQMNETIAGNLAITLAAQRMDFSSDGRAFRPA